MSPFIKEIHKYGKLSRSGTRALGNPSFDAPRQRRPTVANYDTNMEGRELGKPQVLKTSLDLPISGLHSDSKISPAGSKWRCLLGNAN